MRPWATGSDGVGWEDEGRRRGEVPEERANAGCEAWIDRALGILHPGERGREKGRERRRELCVIRE